MYDKLVKRLRICATEAGACKTCELDSNPSCTDYMMKQAADAIAELTKPKWIPVTERLPDCDTPVLIHGSHGGIYTAQYKENGWWKLNSHDHRCSPTHWMQLPPAPKEET